MDRDLHLLYDEVASGYEEDGSIVDARTELDGAVNRDLEEEMSLYLLKGYERGLECCLIASTELGKRSLILDKKITDLIAALDQLADIDGDLFYGEVDYCRGEYANIVDTKLKLDIMISRYILQVNMILSKLIKWRK